MRANLPSHITESHLCLSLRPRCSSGTSHCLQPASEPHQTAIRCHSSAQLRTSLGLSLAQTPGRSYRRLSDPIRSQSKRQAAMMAHYGCAALPQLLCCLTWLCRKAGHPSGMLTTRPAPSLQAEGRALKETSHIIPAASFGGEKHPKGPTQQTLHLTCRHAAATQACTMTWETSR